MPRPAETPLVLPSPVRVCLYARVSDEKQAEKDLSISAQLKAMREYAARQGWVVVGEYIDEGKSGRTDKREAFQQMIQAARVQPKSFDYVICWKMDRFARSREFSVLYKATLRRKGVQVLSLNEPMEDSPAGRLSEGMLESVAQFFSENLGADVRRGMKENASRGYWNGGIAPYGYRIEQVMVNGVLRRKLAPEATTAPAVQRIYALYLQGLGLRRICEILQDEDWPSPQITSHHNGTYKSRWYVQRVHKILTHPVYTGAIRWGNYTRDVSGARRDSSALCIEHAHPAIVSKEDFQRVQERLASRRSTIVHPRTLNSRYLLTGLLRCGYCGASINGNKGGRRAKRYLYYTCVRYFAQGKSTCTAPHHSVPKVDAAVLRDLQALATDTQLLQQIVAESNAIEQAEYQQQQTKSKRHETQLADIDRRLGRLYEALESGSLHHEELAPRIRQLQHQRQQIEQQRAASVQQIPSTPALVSVQEIEHGLSVFAERFPGLSREEQTALLRSFLRRIVVHKHRLTLEYALGVTRTINL